MLGSPPESTAKVASRAAAAQEYSTVCHPLALPEEHAFALTPQRFQHSLPDDCPPGDATLRRQLVYRIVK